MSDAARTQPEPYLDPAWLKAHIDEERAHADRLGEIREGIFGAQDGIISTLAVVSTVGGATGETFAVLVAGIASAFAGIFSMGAGEYMSSKSQREIYLAQIAGEREEVEERPKEAEAEVAYMFERDGLEPAAAKHVAAEIARDKNVLLKTMVEKELGITVDEGAGALQGALVMAGAFGLGSLVPLLPYVFLPVNGGAVWLSVLLAALAMFGIGVLKSRWTRRPALWSGLEIVILAAVAGGAGYLIGNVLPSLLGVRPAV